MEGTGTGGGVAVLLARLMLGVPFVVSSGDAIGPFVAGAHRGMRLPAWTYEWLLCRASAGFIGWTPYLVGRALTLGAPRGVTAAGFTLHPEFPLTRSQVRAALGVPQDALVFGIAGALNWNELKGYCYGLELVRALRRVERDDAVAVIVGEGSGLPRLRKLAGEDLGRRVFLPGPVPPELVAAYLAAMDVGSLPQSLDQVGSLRYTTKITEYITARLPLVTGRMPLAYDLAETWSWRLPGSAPWTEEYVTELAQLIERLTAEEIRERRQAIPDAPLIFDRARQRRSVGAFIAELLDDLQRSPATYR
jgi:glycosyltransferase involved in cell wall biosynthesis